MSDPFRRHGIAHLSPSSLGLFRDSPALFALKYLWRLKEEGAMPRAWLGKAVEAGVDWALYEGQAGAVDAARKQFALDAMGEVSDEIEECRGLIPAMLEQALILMTPLGKPIARQFKIEVYLDGIEVPVQGYIDYLYTAALLDLKTTKVLPSSARPDHKGQVAIYWKAKGVLPSLAYVTPKKGALIPVTEAECEEAIRSLTQSARALRRQLWLAQSKEEFAGLHWPNVEHFRWSDATRAAAQQVWR